MLSCEDNQVPFNFTMKPDNFPRDNLWYVISKAMFFGSTQAIEIDANSEPITKSACLEKNTTYTFHIMDTYGDGVCCEWGYGDFALYWNHQKVLQSNSSSFKKQTLCLSQPQTLNFSILNLELYSYSSDIEWDIVNSKSISLLRHRGSRAIRDFNFGICLEMNECVHLGIRDTSGKGTPYTVTRGDTSISNGNKSFYLDSINTGDCTVCAEGQTLLEFSFFTDYTPAETSWVLLDSNNTIVLQNGDGYNTNRYYHNQTCIPDDECMTFASIDSLGDGGMMYSLKIGDEVIGNRGKFHTGSVEREKINCQNTTCSPGQVLFEIDLVTTDQPELLSWELRDLNNITILAGSNYTTKNRYYYQEECLPATTCLKFRLLDNSTTIGKIYVITWNGSVIQERYDDKFNEFFEDGDC